MCNSQSACYTYRRIPLILPMYPSLYWDAYSLQ